jgi:uncharacterized protein (TIGR03435 family)
VKDFQVAGGPGWAGSDRFDINAKTEGKASFDQMRPMLQTLLEDRFRLMVHRETKESSVYALVPAKSGIKLQPSPEGGCVTQGQGTPPLVSAPGQKPPHFCGALTTSPHSLNATAIISARQFSTSCRINLD